MSKSNIIQGSGGGGKSGGGSTRVAQEAPDSLRSKQFARVVDLVSEGEIGGLKNGLESVFLDDTPIQNPNGTFNFDGVSFASRNGTQNQSHIPGFPSVENEQPVSVEVTNGAPIVRTITDGDIDAVRVTLSVPRLTKQNVKNGDIKGTSVKLAIDVQSDGGGFVSQRLSTGTINLSTSGLTANTGGNDVISASVRVGWTGGVVTGGINSWYSQPSAAPQSITWRVDYREVGTSTWIALQSGSFSGTGSYRAKSSGIFSSGRQYVPPTDATTVSFNPDDEASYEFRLVKTGGSGTLNIDGKAAVFLASDTITGKTSSKYQRAYNIPLTGSPPWDIRVRRLTSDSTSQSLQNQTFWDSYTEIVEAKLRYPNSALMALSVDSERFSRIPVRGYEIEGIIIEVPSNYDTLNRTYSGVWDGTFKNAWTDNPAWIFRDMIVNDRYGCGQFIDDALVDKWALYEISQYCDEFVSNGLGGQEPRFTCNIFLQKPEEAFKVIQSLASVFRAVAFYSAGSVVAVQDSPKEPSALFNPANVIDGQFNYSGSAGKTRATVVLVTWNDPEDRYRQAVEYVEDQEGVANRGIIQKEVTAVGCASRAQAHRFGNAILFSESMETETVTFSVGLDVVGIGPGDIIQTTDPVRAGERLGGRVQSATTTEVTLDADVTIDGESTYTLWCVMPDGNVESREVSTGASTTNVLTVSTAFSDTPQDWSIWVLGSSSLVPETWRVVNIEETDKYTAQITALEYRDDKYEAIEDGVILDDRPTTGLTGRTQDAVTDINLEEELYLINQTTVGTSVSVSFSGNGAYYDIEYKQDEGNYTRVTTSATSVDIRPVTAGDYVFRITAINALGVRSQPERVTKTIYGLTTPPEDVSNFNIEAISGNAHLSFDPSPDLDVIVGGHMRIRHSKKLTGATWPSSVNFGPKIPGTATNFTLPLLRGTYLAKWVDSTGNASEAETLITTNAPSVINLNVVEEIEESPDFIGTYDDTVLSQFANDPAVTFATDTLWDDIEGLMDSWGEIDSYPKILTSGYYYFNESVDLGNSFKSKLSAEIDAISYRLDNLIDDFGLWDDIEGLFDGEDSSGASVQLQVRTTDDDPASTPTWSSWEPFEAGEYQARAYEFRAYLQTINTDTSVALLGCGVTVDMPDKVTSKEDITSPVAGYSVTYSEPFIINPSIGISAQDLQTGDYYQLTNKDKSGFDIIFRNSSGNAIERTFDYIVRGY